MREPRARWESSWPLTGCSQTPWRPGFVATRMSGGEAQDTLETEPFRRTYIEEGRVPLRRSATAAEIAECILWLAGPGNTYVTGQTVTIDGGLTATF